MTGDGANSQVELFRNRADAGSARVCFPALVVWHQRDALVSPEVGRRLVEQLPTARFVDIPGTGTRPDVGSAGGVPLAGHRVPYR
jgi:pimeloyl-ACP methyl ester carboxylesterase